jgi:acylphosphatase
MTSETIVRHVLVEGLVQGVGYREFVWRAAMRLGISGWVRNRSEGTVEARIEGAPASVEAMLAEMRRGPGLAQVTSLRLLDPDHGEAQSGTFAVRPTL